MSEYYYDTFDCNRHSEEINTVDPDELNEVNRLMAEPEPEWEGYSEWSEQVEAEAWAGADEVDTPNGQILVKPQCERTGLHRDCTVYACKRAMRLEGIEI